MKLTEATGGFFALDVGLDSLRLAEMVGNPQRGWILEAFAYLPIDRRITMADSETAKRNIGEIMFNAMQKSGIKEKRIAIGLSRQKAFTGVVEIAANEKDTKTIDKLVNYQANQLIPIDIDKAKIDYAILGSPINDLTKTEVLLSAVRDSEAEAWMKMVEGYGLELIALEPNDVAMARALMPTKPDQMSLIIFMREDETTIAMTYGGKPRLFKNISLGFDEVVTNVAQKLNVDRREARQLITAAGFFTDKYEGQIAKLLDVELNKLIAEILDVTNVILIKYPGFQLEEIIAGGFLTVMPAVARYLQMKLNVATKLGNPFQRVNLTTQQKAALEPVAGEFTVACGLAERMND